MNSITPTDLSPEELSFVKLSCSLSPRQIKQLLTIFGQRECSDAMFKAFIFGIAGEGVHDVDVDVHGIEHLVIILSSLSWRSSLPELFQSALDDLPSNVHEPSHNLGPLVSPGERQLIEQGMFSLLRSLTQPGPEMLPAVEQREALSVLWRDYQLEQIKAGNLYLDAIHPESQVHQRLAERYIESSAFISAANEAEEQAFGTGGFRSAFDNIDLGALNPQAAVELFRVCPAWFFDRFKQQTLTADEQGNIREAAAIQAVFEALFKDNDRIAEHAFHELGTAALAIKPQQFKKAMTLMLSTIADTGRQLNELQTWSRQLKGRKDVLTVNSTLIFTAAAEYMLKYAALFEEGTSAFNQACNAIVQTLFQLLELESNTLSASNLIPWVDTCYPVTKVPSEAMRKNILSAFSTSEQFKMLTSPAQLDLTLISDTQGISCLDKLKAIAKESQSDCAQEAVDAQIMRALKTVHLTTQVDVPYNRDDDWHAPAL